MDRVVLIADVFALQDERSLQFATARQFNNDKIGGCLLPVCQSLPADMLQVARKTVGKVFSTLHKCFLELKDKYLHFVFPLPDKDLFFRSLSNIVLLHLEIKNAIALPEGIKPPPFNFSV